MAMLTPMATVLPNPSNALAVLGTTPVLPDSAPAANTGLRSLYVGDLHQDVTEAQLFDKFSKIGPVLSIRVCRDAVTRRSLGYAYVNYTNTQDAERAIESMNFELLHNRPIRIMWSQRDPSLRRSTAGNIFIKNLDKRIDVKSLYDTFMLFGKILSCKISMDPEGNSKGYGFIHFEKAEDAQEAINRVNGMMLDEKKVYVAKFLTRSERFGEGFDGTTRFTNVYVKNFADHLDDRQLRELFSKFGEITSSIVMKDAEGKSRGFGFVAYEKPEEAAKAVEEMNEYELPETHEKLTVCRAQKKAERQAELLRRQAQWKSEFEKKWKGSNLYVKNLDESVTDEELRKIFEEFGNITSAKVMTDENKRSKCFGFVCFDSPDSATKARDEKHGKMHGNKPLYVAMAQRKEDRQAQLATKYMKNMNQMRTQGPTGMPNTMYQPAGNYFMPSTVQNQPQAFMPGTFHTSQMRGGTPRFNQMGYMIQGASQNFQMRNQRPNYSRRPQGQMGQGSQRGAMGGSQGQQQRQQQNKPAQVMFPQYTVMAPPSQMQIQSVQPAQMQMQSVQPAQMQMQSVQPPQMQMQSVQPPQMQMQPAQSSVVSQPTQWSAQELSAVPVTTQKQIIGQKLYELVQTVCPAEDVAKITGMLLEMDMTEVVHMLEDGAVLKSKVSEAVAVLHGVPKEPQPQA